MLVSSFTGIFLFSTKVFVSVLSMMIPF